jgi:selenocysteine lyase/cysteine desulfurase
LPINIHKIKPDFLVAAGYKWLMSPYGLSYLYVDKQYHLKGEPIEYNWINKKGSEDFSSLINYVDEYKPGAGKFDAGQHAAFIHVPIAIASLRQLLDWGIENIQETIAVLTNAIEAKARALDFDIPGKSDLAGHMIGLTLSEKQVAILKKRLPQNNIYVSFRGNNMRIAPHLYNSLQDVERLFDIIKQVR